MGLILTTLILTAPPMAAMFFQGTLGTHGLFADRRRRRRCAERGWSSAEYLLGTSASQRGAWEQGPQPRALGV